MITREDQLHWRSCLIFSDDYQFIEKLLSIKGFGNMYGGSKFQTRLGAYSGELVKNALPVKTNLVRRNVLAEDICEHCKQVPEDMIYAIWLCSGFIIDEGKDLAQFAMFIQTLWFRRNRLFVEDKPFPLSDILPMVKQIQADYLRVNLGPSPLPLIIQRDRVRLHALFSPLVKVNFDGAVFQDLGEVSSGVVVRDSQGKVLASMSEKILLPHSVADVEAMATVLAINFALNLSLTSVIIKGDSEIIIKALSSENDSFFSYGHLIVEAKFYSAYFSSFQFSHIHRYGNTIAHKLAKHDNNFQVLMENVPQHINSVFLTDFG
ncbi:uncharacterized protein LOC142605960 [Castanea sativa]|uniref:uncharacterized protein LOC142605960 n=1 Tax=Castanea sativa TaxID=21020 RepID=UPI003F65031A